MSETWTITFGECVENHAGMEKIGEEVDEGLTEKDIRNIGMIFKKMGHKKIELFYLEELLPNKIKEKFGEINFNDACILVVRNGVKRILDDDINDFTKEVLMTKDLVDKKALMRGRVVNKHARWNLCYGDTSSDADIENGKGTVIGFDRVPYLQKIREFIGGLCPEKTTNLFAELNYYYDIRTCGIGYHGDTERKIVVGIRIGSPMSLHYQWFLEREPIGKNFGIMLNDGDIYFMGSKAVGFDWKRYKIPTLRHAAGCKKYTQL